MMLLQALAALGMFGGAALIFCGAMLHAEAKARLRGVDDRRAIAEAYIAKRHR